MNEKEIQRRKSALANTLMKELNNFQKDTGCTICHMTFKRAEKAWKTAGKTKDDDFTLTVEKVIPEIVFTGIDIDLTP